MRGGDDSITLPEMYARGILFVVQQTADYEWVCGFRSEPELQASVVSQLAAVFADELSGYLDFFLQQVQRARVQHARN